MRNTQTGDYFTSVFFTKDGEAYYVVCGDSFAELKRKADVCDELVAALEYYADRENHYGEQGAGVDVALNALRKARGEAPHA